MPPPTYACIVDDIYLCPFTTTRYVDWYNHLKNAHPDTQTRVWYCDEPSDRSPGETCHLGFSNVGLFKAHRKDCHTCPLTNNPNDFQVGPLQAITFYCGFCKQVFTTLPRRWWHARAQHIAKHFEEGKTYEDYTHMNIVNLIDRSQHSGQFLPQEGEGERTGGSGMGITGC
jgi:hypothetical protein